ncbi:hypothetical protein NFX46_00440 [Streptomyces phaeoluteigriseus]|uniref:Uncharacterized protein n=1 Tax=Streptomyces phaeoluteigriseus TaxID=114686 RepID=A0ABY4Z1I5_9ACTN|nr:hypothetical protein [Streptomyces phaeoluteigriseus]USQ82370.1 hypothetical protein NFX46_00440 [Streptomyces phaeoluteigriseus]
MVEAPDEALGAGTYSPDPDTANVPDASETADGLASARPSPPGGRVSTAAPVGLTRPDMVLPEGYGLGRVS